VLEKWVYEPEKYLLQDIFEKTVKPNVSLVVASD
jgi:hypothetical protein